MSATTTQLISSGEFCKLHYDTIPVKSASANVSFYINNTKMPNFELWPTCRKWYVAVFISPPQHTTIHSAIDASTDIQNPRGTQ